MHKEGITMATPNNFMLKLLLLFFGLASHEALAQISKKPDVASSAILPGGFQASTLLTSVINKADVVLHEVDNDNAQSNIDANADELFDMDDAEVLTDIEEGDDTLDDINDLDSGDLSMSSTANSEGGKGIKARLICYKKSECVKKRGGEGKKMKEGKCHTLHKKHFQSYQFSIHQKGSKKKDKDDEAEADYDDVPSKACRIIIYHDGKCKDEASTANEMSCEDMDGADDDEDDEDDEELKLHARDLMKPKGGKYKSAKFLCDGVVVSSHNSSSITVSEYYSVTSDYYSVTSSYHSTTSDHYSVTSSFPEHAWNVNATSLPSRSIPPSSVNATLSSKTISGEPTSTDVPDEEDEEDFDENEGEEEVDDEKEEADEEGKNVKTPGSQITKTRKHRSKSHKKTKGHNKHPETTQSTVTITQLA
jgi:hypothetical protein